MLDNVFRWNPQTVLRTIREAEVISLFFPYIGKALIVDLRHTQREGPMVSVDGLVSGPKERMDRLKRLRPQLEEPCSISIAPWIGAVRTLETAGVLAELSGRLRATGHAAAEERLNQAFRELLATERGEVVALIRGDHQRTKTLYQR